MSIIPDTISINHFLDLVCDEMDNVEERVVLTAEATSVLFPLKRSIEPFLEKADIELLKLVQEACRFHANAFDFPMPGRLYIVQRQFWEFSHYLEKVWKNNFIDGQLPEEYSKGCEKMYVAYENLNQIMERESIDHKTRQRLTAIITNLIYKHLTIGLYCPVISAKIEWRSYPNYGLDVLVGHYYIVRKQIPEGWIYCNMKNFRQLKSTQPLDRYGIARLLSKDTYDVIAARELEGDVKYTDVSFSIIGKFDPWNKSV